jgi:hypothetical protein
MKRRALLALPLLATGCLPDLTGAWMGRCDFEDETYEETSVVEVTIENGRGNRVEGSMFVLMFDDRELQGPMSGVRSDTFIELDANFPTQDGTFTFHIEGDVDEDEVDGTCTLGVPGGGAGAGLSGGLVLER